MMPKYPNEILTRNDMKKLSTLLVNKHTPNDPDVFKQFNVNQSELIKGVHCPCCYSLPMARGRGEWVCFRCQFACKEAHIESLKDYEALFRPTITNQQIRQFLQLPSRSVATSILKSMKMKNIGRTKGREYLLHFREE